MVRLLFVSFLLFSSLLKADVIVLVHGFLGNTESWQYSGINQALAQQQWQLKGLIQPGPRGMQQFSFPQATGKSERNSYAVGLFSRAPIALQSQQLHQALQLIRQQHPDEKLILVGHSAGGIVARLHLVQYPATDIKALVTIASPHLGTSRAEQALDITNIPFPFSMITEFFGGSDYDLLESSRGLLIDLIRPRPGSLLHWLNAQPHPDISYYSMVRGTPYSLWGDQVVPGYSQDMNNVYALRGKSTTITVATGHTLEYRDGLALVHILEQLDAGNTTKTQKQEKAEKPQLSR